MRKLCRVLFSRYAISAIMIVFEVLATVYLAINAWGSLYVLAAVAAVYALAAIISLINRDANPEYKTTWAVIIFILPVLGPTLYLLFYQRRMSKKETRLIRGAIMQMRGHEKENDALESLAEESSRAAGKALAIMSDDPTARVYKGTASTFYSSGEVFFSAMQDDLSKAESFIFLEYFIIETGELWDRIHAILREKVKCGVEVRILYDDIGCMKTLPQGYDKQLAAEGIAVYRFARVNPRVSSVHHNRDHRKICIIDGKIGYTGGVNIADEYINRKLRFGHWRDGGVRLVGDAVSGLIKLFLSSWDFTSRTISDYERFLGAVTPAESADGGYYLPFGSGPYPVYQRPVGKNAFLNIINQAERYVYITTPYLIIDYDLTEALCNAARRGVDVRIITPGIADKKIIKIMTKSAYPYLIKAGVLIYEYTPGFIHEKTLICDDEYAVIGTINFDYRSLVHHFEDAVWMYNTECIPTIKEEYFGVVERSARVDETKSRLTFLEWIFKNGIRLFAPLL